MNNVTVLWPLPPRKGISSYVKWFVKSLWKKVDVEVLDFKKLYPDFLYPGWNPRQKGVEIPKYIWVESRQILTRRNPFSWIQAWLWMKWSILHMQYRIWFLAPIFITIWLIWRYVKWVPVVITIHNVEPHEKAFWKKRIDNLVYKVATSYIVHSHQNKQQLVSLVWDSKQISIIPHWIIVPEVEKISTWIARSQLWISNDAIVILFFWVIRPYKWLQLALEWLSQLLESNDSYHMIIAWKCRWDWDEYENLISDLKLQKYVTRISWFLDDLQLSQVFSASDCLILPYTHFDAQSWVLALWLWFEMPVIVSDLWWLTDIIDNSKYVHWVWDVKDMVSKISSLDIQSAISYIKTKKDTFSWETIVEDMLVVYNEIHNHYK